MCIMSIYDFLSVNQVNAFIDLIRNECNRVAWNAAERARPLPQDLYERLVKGRKEHDITGDIYVSAFYPNNQIDGIDIHEVNNGNYTQPEFTIDNTIIHIYHNSNKLTSNLVTERKNYLDNNFFCIMYQTDGECHLKYINAVYIHGNNKNIERIYTTPNIAIQAG